MVWTLRVQVDGVKLIEERPQSFRRGVRREKQGQSIGNPPEPLRQSIGDLVRAAHDGQLCHQFIVDQLVEFPESAFAHKRPQWLVHFLPADRSKDASIRRRRAVETKQCGNPRSGCGQLLIVATHSDDRPADDLDR